MTHSGLKIISRLIWTDIPWYLVEAKLFWPKLKCWRTLYRRCVPGQVINFTGTIEKAIGQEVFFSQYNRKCQACTYAAVQSRWHVKAVNRSSLLPCVSLCYDANVQCDGHIIKSRYGTTLEPKWVYSWPLHTSWIFTDEYFKQIGPKRCNFHLPLSWIYRTYVLSLLIQQVSYATIDRRQIEMQFGYSHGQTNCDSHPPRTKVEYLEIIDLKVLEDRLARSVLGIFTTLLFRDIFDWLRVHRWVRTATINILWRYLSSYGTIRAGYEHILDSSGCSVSFLITFRRSAMLQVLLIPFASHMVAAVPVSSS